MNASFKSFGIKVYPRTNTPLKIDLNVNQAWNVKSAALNFRRQYFSATSKNVAVKASDKPVNASFKSFGIKIYPRTNTPLKIDLNVNQAWNVKSAALNFRRQYFSATSKN
ncbi:MAG: hypothetical protein IJT73_09170, partial [Selenomonadaceae bacterium]|nr:hypothetical protein [Selenomonadaceae bacterium]